MKKISFVLIIICVFGFISTVNAGLISEWGLISPDSTMADGSQYIPGRDFGYYIWTDTENRTSWHLRWSGDTLQNPGANYSFTGSIRLENVIGEFEEWAFEASQDALYDVTLTGTDFRAVANVHEDGIDIKLSDWVSPSYIGFDLKILDKKSNTYFDDVEAFTYIGTDHSQTVASLGEDEDFSIAAPVPEPGTMILLGFGLIGLAAFGRKKGIFQK